MKMRKKLLINAAILLITTKVDVDAFQIGTATTRIPNNQPQQQLYTPFISSVSPSQPLQPSPSNRLTKHNGHSNNRLSTTNLHYMNIQRDADFGELYAGGQRYEMVELPDSMIDTTIFVGNLCEFVTDDMLSSLFQQVSRLSFVPACVARKPNMSSLKYGFVTFPTVSEKEAAIIKFTGYELNNKRMKVEEIQDFDKVRRVRVPEKLVVYAVGEVKRTREGKNTMRRVTNSRENGRPSSGSSRSSVRYSSSGSSSGGGYKNMKRKQKRKNRRMKSNKWDDYGLA